MSELVDAAGGLKEKIAKAISGGPMMGFALYDLHTMYEDNFFPAVPGA